MMFLAPSCQVVEDDGQVLDFLTPVGDIVRGRGLTQTVVVEGHVELERTVAQRQELILELQVLTHPDAHGETEVAQGLTTVPQALMVVIKVINLNQRL